MERHEYTRIDTIRKYVDDMLKGCTDLEAARNGYVHMYGVGQNCALISFHRGHDLNYAQLSEISGMLHDYAKYRDHIADEHAERGCEAAKEILLDAGCFNPEEIDIICTAIYNHSDKDRVDDEFSEILKDADELQHWLRNPTEKFYMDKQRVQQLIKEFNLSF